MDRPGRFDDGLLDRNGAVVTPIEWKLSAAVAKQPPVGLGGTWRGRLGWLPLVPVGFLLMIGLFIPGFLLTLALLLFCTAAALGGFVLLVQLPVGFVLRRWREFRLRPVTEPSRRTPTRGNGLAG